jgi:hypothetical protein
MNYQANTQEGKRSKTVSQLNESVLQRKCACGNHTIAGGTCNSCNRSKEATQLQRSVANEEPVKAIPTIVPEVLRSAGQPLEKGTQAFFESHFGYDFSHVRVHSDAKAAESAEMVGAMAYAMGNDVVFGAGQYQPNSAAGQELLAHELAHVTQPQASTGLMRAPKPDTAQPRTFIIAYGSGQVAPTTNSHNLGNLLEVAAKQKLFEIKARLGKKAKLHNIIFAYTPTETALKGILNKSYGAPIAEIHIFSHGWPGGANLGGPIPPNKKRPLTESDPEQEERWLQKTDLGGYNLAFAEDAVVTLYGCNIGNAKKAAGNQPFAQDMSDQYGVSVTASTKSTHFDQTNGWHQIPDAGGKMRDFTPTETTVRFEIKIYQDILSQIKIKEAELASLIQKGGLLNALTQTDHLKNEIKKLRGEAAQKRDYAHRLLRFFPEAERASVLAEVNEAETLAGY